MFNTYCEYCGNICGNQYWFNETLPKHLKFCKKSCVNNYIKQKDFDKADKSGCALCGEKSDKYFGYEGDVGNYKIAYYCSRKHAKIAETKPIIIEINYN